MLGVELSPVDDVENEDALLEVELLDCGRELGINVAQPRQQSMEVGLRDPYAKRW